MSSRPLYIFDLDGTLALIEHRRHFIEKDRGSQDWTSFYAACVDDMPNLPVIYVAEALITSGAEIWIFSGRSDEVRAQTERWLSIHLAFWETNLTMRRAGDYTPDDVLKRGWLRDMLEEDRARLVAIFEDRDRMVSMWRAERVPCFQVANGDF